MALHAAAQSRSVEASSVSVIAAKFCGGAPRTGSEKGPQALLDSGLGDYLQHHLDGHVHFRDCCSRSDEHSPDKSDDHSNGMKCAHCVSNFTKELSSNVSQCFARGTFPLTLGGDHSIAIGTLTGVAEAVREAHPGVKLATIWFDAHADINKPESSPSGYLHGMPVAFASGIAQHRAFRWIEDRHLIDLDKFVYIGLRDVDEEEWNSISSSGIKYFDMHDIAKLGVEKVMDQVLEHLGTSCMIHLSFDIDGLDPSWAPSTGFPVGNGVSLTDACYITRRIHETSRLVAMDLAEINPTIATQGLDETLKSARAVIYSALGIEVSWAGSAVFENAV